jgi:hypothetical protein
MKSNAQTQASILDTLRRATAPITLPGIADRMGEQARIIRPTLGSLAASRQVRASNSKPTTYSLPQENAAAHRSITNSHAGGTYSGVELQRNPGITAERYVAFQLPSRVGDRLHWPDGRTTRVTDPR